MEEAEGGGEKKRVVKGSGESKRQLTLPELPRQLLEATVTHSEP